ncbi:MAG: hypothetical protein K9J12_18375 [Melioribacteraceae bacterium]|nr:hypothetical protein [Melioribacteraceae bacterium]MCF8265659.1 hypothetical protein [Melioribacteraceae bacterium]
MVNIKKIIFLLLLLFVSSLEAQSDSTETIEKLIQLQRDYENVTNKLDSLSGEITEQGNSLFKLKNLQKTNSSHLNRLNNLLSALTDSTNLNKNLIQSLGDSVENKSQNLSKEIIKTKDESISNFNSLEESLSRNTLYWIIGILLVAVLSLIGILLLRNKMNQSNTSIEKNLSNTRKELETEAIKLDQKLMQILETQLKVMDSERNETASPAKVDHSLALKVADEIVRMEKNLKLMDPETRGLKQLSKAVERIKNNFEANGYEMVEMLGKEYSDGMKATVNIIIDETLNESNRIITRIIKPQVNFQGEMIQSAQIEVSQAI